MSEPMRNPTDQGKIPTMITTFEKGIEQGRRHVIRMQLEKRFGPLRSGVQRRLEDWPAERLNELLLALLDAPSLKALGLEE